MIPYVSVFTWRFLKPQVMGLWKLVLGRKNFKHNPDAVYGYKIRYIDGKKIAVKIFMPSKKKFDDLKKLVTLKRAAECKKLKRKKLY